LGHKANAQAEKQSVSYIVSPRFSDESRIRPQRHTLDEAFNKGNFVPADTICDRKLIDHSYAATNQGDLKGPKKRIQ